MDESTPALEQLRHEIKFVTRANERAAILQWVRNHWAGFGEPYPDRVVNNVYFDSFELAAFHENLSGTSRRSKVRWRWYGDTRVPERGTLEVKRRRGGLGWKLSFPTGGGDLSHASWQQLRRRIRGHLDCKARIWFDANPLPILINRYRRRYFASGDGRVRLTMDWDQKVYDQKLRSRPNLRRTANLPDTLVVELKFPVREYANASAIIQGLPLRLSRNSKYVIGVQSIASG